MCYPASGNGGGGDGGGDGDGGDGGDGGVWGGEVHLPPMTVIRMRRKAGSSLAQYPRIAVG